MTPEERADKAHPRCCGAKSLPTLPDGRGPLHDPWCPVPRTAQAIREAEESAALAERREFFIELMGHGGRVIDHDLCKEIGAAIRARSTDNG